MEGRREGGRGEEEEEEQYRREEREREWENGLIRGCDGGIYIQ